MSTRVLFDADRERHNPRRCAQCSLCCKLLPMPILKKPAGKPCQFQRFGKGCTIYANRPPECAFWSCRWLLNDDTADQIRPDKSHLVIDSMPDYVEIVDNETGQRRKLEVVQAWIDPDYPDAHRDPVFRAYLYRRAQEGVAARIRYDNARALHIMAPPLMQDRQWQEWAGGTVRPQHTAKEIDDALKLRRILTVEP